MAAREEEERGNAMKALENRTLDSKKEMDIMDALEELIVSAAPALCNTVDLRSTASVLKAHPAISANLNWLA